MSSHRLSMSKLGLAHKCLYGFRKDVQAFERPTGKAATIGKITHSLVEAKVNGTLFVSDAAPELVTEARAIFDGPLSGYVSTYKWTVCEQGYRYNSATDSTADGPRRGEPGYDSVVDSVLPGTLDLAFLAGDYAMVIDVKTGKPPADSEQLYGQAVAISRRLGVRTVHVAYARALKTKFELLNKETLDGDRLDAEAGRIRKLLRVLPTSEPQPGEWCWRCDARPVCPAHPKDDEYVPCDPPTEAVAFEGSRLF